jgi:hypothetical protein
MPVIFSAVNSERTNLSKVYAGSEITVGHIKHDDDKIRYNGLSIEDLEQILMKMRELENVRVGKVNKRRNKNAIQ